jgi:hypothetical protein
MSWTPYLIIGVIAFLIYSPAAYAITNAILSPIGVNTTDAFGRPTWFGVLFQTVLLILILKLILTNSE